MISNMNVKEWFSSNFTHANMPNLSPCSPQAEILLPLGQNVQGETKSEGEQTFINGLKRLQQQTVD